MCPVVLPRDVLFYYIFSSTKNVYYLFILQKIYKTYNSVRGCRPGKLVDLTESEIKMVCLRSRDLMIQQPMLLELQAPIKIVGDTHGQYYDMLRIFDYGECCVVLCALRRIVVQSN